VLVGAGVSVTVGLDETVTVAVTVGGTIVEVLVEVALDTTPVVTTGTKANWLLKPPHETTKNTISNSTPKDTAKTTGLFISLLLLSFLVIRVPLIIRDY